MTHAGGKRTTQLAKAGPCSAVHSRPPAKKLGLAIAIGSLVMSSACGGLANTSASRSKSGSPNSAGQSGSATTAPSAAGSKSAVNGGSSNSRPGAKGQAPTATVPGAGPSSTTSTTFAKLDSRLAKSCLHPGDTQTLTIRDAPPTVFFIYSTTYSNGSNKLSGHYATGDGHGQVDHAGNAQATWVVPPGAPAGPAEVTSGAPDGKGSFLENHSGMLIQPIGQPCP